MDLHGREMGGSGLMSSWAIAGIGNVLVVLCRSNVTKSLGLPTHPSPSYFYIQQPLKHVNLILSKLSF